MRRIPSKLSYGFAFLAILIVTAVSGGDAVACLILSPAPETATASPAVPLDLDAWTPTLEEVAGGSSCCDPALEPGVGGNPFCFEGHSCCANGQWQCNNPDATPSCTVCGSACGLSGAVCSVNSDCCSGKCKGNHRCR